MRLRIITLNIHKGLCSLNRRFVLTELKSAVKESAADLVFLQEVIGEHAGLAARHAHSWPAESQYEYLADGIWSDYAYGKNAVYSDGHHGNAILSKYPIKDWKNIDVSLSKRERRGLLHCDIETPRGRIHCICVHLSLTLGDRRKQIARLVELTKTIPANEPCIIAGDFNDWHKKLTPPLTEGAGVYEAFEYSYGRPMKTFPARWPILPLDRVYLKNLHVEEAHQLPRMPWARLSDHIPLSVDITLPGELNVS